MDRGRKCSIRLHETIFSVNLNFEFVTLANPCLIRGMPAENKLIKKRSNVSIEKDIVFVAFFRAKDTYGASECGS